MSIAEKINNATNEKLTSENWEAIIIACDAITGADAAGVKAAFNIIYKRLASPAGNAQMFTLTLLNALSQSGSTQTKAMIASTDTRQSLSHVLGSSHRAVRDRALDIITDLAETLQDPEFSKFADANSKSAGNASGAADGDADEEEEQIRRAIELSMKDQTAGAAPQSRKDNRQSNESNEEILQKVHRKSSPASASSASANEVRQAKTLYAFSSSTQGDLSFGPGEIITVIESTHKDWWKGSLNGQVGVFPSNYVEAIASKPMTEEDYIFAQAPNVEKLLSIFASASQQPGYSIVSNPNIQAMYDQVLALRPQLIRLIDEYSARKEKLMQLNGDVVEARQRYEELVNARMAPQPEGLRQYSQSHTSERPRMQAQSPSRPSTHMPSQAAHEYTQAPAQSPAQVPAAAHHQSQPSAPPIYDYPTHAASAPSAPGPMPPSGSMPFHDQYQAHRTAPSGAAPLGMTSEAVPAGLANDLPSVVANHGASYLPSSPRRSSSHASQDIPHVSSTLPYPV